MKSFLKVLPPVDFCCIYGSSLLPHNNDKALVFIFFSFFKFYDWFLYASPF
ncbi:hypothetical protein NC653_009328 [Populus alba x Populus x berolinensis]|uniref:Uncharacterized protein n=1 Tax=Populus alba x Populus x berolinensis TaxID=444605 RepID=A0AAD6R948_9ROSI|nr:hypothetical protein NC653_009328 [Populus alba x Populus x berolinensis]